MVDLSAEQHLRIANLLSGSPDISRRRLLVLGGVGLGSLGLAACTSSGSNPSKGTSTPTTGPGPTGTCPC